MSRLLVAAGESATSIDKLPFGVRALLDAADEILVVTPALPSRLEWLASATDKARDRADKRLSTVLRQIERTGNEAAGEVGADDPLLAFEDALAEFPAEHILIGVRGDAGSDWQEDDLSSAIYEKFGLPTTIFTTP